MVRFHSADGLRWARDAAPLVKLGADSQTVAFWDPRSGTYALYLRGWQQRADKKLYRIVVRADLPNLTETLPVGPSEKSRFLWGKEKVAVIDDEFPKVFATDDSDPDDSDVYTISAQPYALDPRWYLGFPSLFQREKSRSDGRLDVECIGSRDGFQWHRYDRAPYARPGLAGTESASMVFIGPGMVVRGDEIWQYGVGLRSRHGDVEDRKRQTDGAIYRYVQRVDGFVSLDFGLTNGRCITSPIKVSGSKLLLNVDTAVLGSLRLALLEEDGSPIAGFGEDDCDVLRTNSTRAEVSWKRRQDLRPLAGKTVKLSLAGSRAKLFSFRFE